MALCGSGTTGSLSISDTQDNAWTPVNPVIGVANQGSAATWMTTAKAATADTIRCSAPSGWRNVMVDEFSGIGSFVAHTERTGNGNPATTSSLGLQPGELLWAAANGSISGVNAPFQTGVSDGSADYTGYFIAASSMSHGASFPNSGYYEAFAATFLPASSGGGGGTLPTIASFTATPSSIQDGSSSTLSWSTSGATSATLNGASVATSGSQSVSPTQTTAYTLQATNSAGGVSQQVTVTVSAPPPPTSTTLTAGAISCTLQNNSGTAVLNCNNGQNDLGSMSLPQSTAPGWQFAYTLGSDSLNVTLSPTGSGGWTWQATTDGTQTSGTI